MGEGEKYTGVGGLGSGGKGVGQPCKVLDREWENGTE